MKKIELLAPGGGLEAIKAAVLAGADAVYCGINKFNARNRAQNIDFDDLNPVVKFAHTRDCKIYLTLNIIILETEIADLVNVLNRLVNTDIDGVIVQDLGVFYILSKYFKSLKIHASTQCTTHNRGQIEFLNRLNAVQINLSRELSLDEIRALTRVAHEKNIATEIFVHGSYCISFSGLCYMSSLKRGSSGNRGRCSQPCRDAYPRTASKNIYPLNLKDNSAYHEVGNIYNSGVDSIKIEGRIKKSDYVYTVVKAYKEQLNRLYAKKELKSSDKSLFRVFNREYSSGFLNGVIDQSIYSEHVRDNVNSCLLQKQDEFTKNRILDEKAKVKEAVKKRLDSFNISKTPLIIHLSGRAGKPMKIVLNSALDKYELFSEENLSSKGRNPINIEMILKRFKVINEIGYFIERVDLNFSEKRIFISYKELSKLKKRLLSILRSGKEIYPAIELPQLKKNSENSRSFSKTEAQMPSLSILISSKKDILLCENRNYNVFYKLPENYDNNFMEYINIFRENQNLYPWFPSILIGENYEKAVKLLKSINPEKIVTDNTGIAWEAYKNKITWIAGPFLNIVNSYSLVCLKEKFNCSGAFISNEINRAQMKRMVKPNDFSLFYSIYHPIELMTSRQCFFYQITGCQKKEVDETCLLNCQKQADFKNSQGDTFFVNKAKGEYNRIYSENRYLNTKIFKDYPDRFSCFLIDLRDVRTGSFSDIDKKELVKLFTNYLKDLPNAAEILENQLAPFSDTQYKRGI